MTNAQPVDAHATVEALIRERLATAVGGHRGAAEMALPTVVFITLWVLTHEVRPSVIAALVVAVVLGVVRLVQRSSLQHVLGAVVAAGIAAWFALRSGRAQDAFLPGILLSTGYGTAVLVSILARWPAVGFLVGLADPRAAEDPFAWRRDRAVVAVCQRLTWVLVGLYAVRLAIMVPLYLAGHVAALGAAKIALGWPLWLAALSIMATLLVRGETPLESDGPADQP